MQRAIDPSLFDWPADDPRLIGSECKGCGVVSFPRQFGCPRCCGTDVEARRLGKAGRLWSWTTQEFAPKSPPYAVTRRPEDFVPFLLGYVELPGEVIVESRIAAAPDQVLGIGMPMQLTFAPLFTDEQGVEVICFSFTPTQERT